MNIIAVNDERAALHLLTKAIKEVEKNAELNEFSFSTEALAYAENNTVDVAFLDIDMPEMNGLVLAKKLKDICGKTNIIFVTGHSVYAQNAINLRASGFVLKPIDPRQVREELDNLRNPPEPPPARVRFQCFGSFAVFVNGNPLLFPRPKTKELLADLVHKRGAVSTTAEISSILWEEKAYSRSTQTQTRKIIAALIKALTDAGIEDVIKKGWNSIAVCTDKVSCDMYELLNGNVAAFNSYTGEYMNEYTWAEFTVEYLNEKIKQ